MLRFVKAAASAYVSIRQHTSASVSIRQHPSSHLVEEEAALLRFVKAAAHPRGHRNFAPEKKKSVSVIVL